MWEERREGVGDKSCYKVPDTRLSVLIERKEGVREEGARGRVRGRVRGRRDEEVMEGEV